MSLGRDVALPTTPGLQASDEYATVRLYLYPGGLAFLLRGVIALIAVRSTYRVQSIGGVRIAYLIAMESVTRPSLAHPTRPTCGVSALFRGALSLRTYC